MLVYYLKKKKKTYLGYPEIQSLVKNFINLNKKRGRNLLVAEFGVGRGGSAIILSYLINKFDGKPFLFDSFQLIPPPTVVDGEKAFDRYNQILSNKNDTDYYGNIKNLKDVIAQEISEICPLDKVEFIVGYYQDTLKNYKKDVFFDLVHIDCDWYQSYKEVLDFLHSRLNEGAILQLDDYNTWEGVSKALEEAKWLMHYKKILLRTGLVIDTSLQIE
jgi:hypothetical protein